MRCHTGRKCSRAAPRALCGHVPSCLWPLRTTVHRAGTDGRGASRVRYGYASLDGTPAQTQRCIVGIRGPGASRAHCVCVSAGRSHGQTWRRTAGTCGAFRAPNARALPECLRLCARRRSVGTCAVPPAAQWPQAAQRQRRHALIDFACSARRSSCVRPPSQIRCTLQSMLETMIRVHTQ